MSEHDATGLLTVNRALGLIQKWVIERMESMERKKSASGPVIPMSYTPPFRLNTECPWLVPANW